MSQLTTHLLHRHSLWHGVLVEGEGDVGAVALGVTVCAYGRPVSRHALALRRAGLYETLLVTQRHTQLTQGTVPSPGAEHTAGFRATPQLSTGHDPLVAVAGVAVFGPLRSVYSNTTSSHTRTSGDFLTPGPGPAGGAQAAVAVNLIHTRGTERTGRRLALIDVDATVRPCESTGTLTAVPVITVHTRTAVITWLWVAVVGILAAGEPFPAFFADTGEAVTRHDTRGSVLTGVRQAAAVLCYITGSAFPSRSTHALERVAFV